MHLGRAYRVPLTGVAAILYRDGDDFQGLHGDRELRRLDDALIAIVVLGERRPFVLRPRAAAGGGVSSGSPAGRIPDDLVLTPGRGDMLVMGGACQRDWLHGIPATDHRRGSGSRSPGGGRAEHRGRPDTNPGYYDGKQYSDRPRQAGSRTRQPWPAP